MRRLALASTLATCLFLPTVASALGLGEIELQSALNQRLDAEIPLRGVPAEQIDNIEVKLASEKAFQDVGLERPFSLTKLRFRVRQSDQDRYFVHVTSSEPIAEPFLSFLVRVDWPNGNLLREYTVLLDPPVFASEDEQTDTAGSGQAADPGDADEAGVPGEIERSAKPETEQASPDQTGDSGQAETDTQAQQTSERGGGDYGDEPVFLQVEREQEEAEQRRQREAEAEREAEQRDEAGQPDAEQATSSPDQQASTGAASAGGGGDYGPVQKGEALWSIAERLKSGDVTVQQMMIALLRYNPEAFAGDNVNRLKQGYVLRVPDMAEVRRISAQKAVAQVGEQNAMWQEWRQARSGSGTREAAPSEPGDGDASASAGAADDGELDIVGAQEGGATADEEASATASGDASTSEQLQLAREQLESVRMEKEELTSRVEKLEGTVEKMEKLITLREEKLSQLQQQLETLREQKSGSTTGDEATASAETEAGATQQAGTSDDDAGTSAGDTGGDEQTEQASAESDAAGTDDAASEGATAEDTQGDEASESGTGTGSDTATAEESATGDSEESTDEVAAVDEDTSDETAGGADTDGGGDGASASTSDSGGDGDTASDGETETTTAEADGDASDSDDAGASDATQASDQSPPEQGVQTSRTQPAQESWLDMVSGIVAAAAGVIGGLFVGGVTSPGALGLAALLVLALVGALIARRRRAQSDEDEPAPEPILAEAEATDSFTETDPGLDAFTEPSEATGSTALSDTGSTQAAESALMEERLDLSDLEGGDEGAAVAEDEEEAAKDDTVAEADVYLAYGLHQQAEDVLRLALKESPQRADYQEKLLETLYSAGKRDDFVTEAKTYQGMIDPASSRGWQRVVAMGREIAPDDALFRSTEDPGVSPEELQPSKPESADFELDDSASGEPALDLSLDDAGGESEASTDDQGRADTMMLDTSDFEVGGASAGEGPETPAETPGGDEELEFDLSAWDDGEPAAGPPESTSAEETADASSVGEEFDFDLSDMDLSEPKQQDDPSPASEAPASAGSAQEEDALDLDLEEPGEDAATGAGSTDHSSTPAEPASSPDDDLEFDLGDLDVGADEPAAGGGSTSESSGSASDETTAAAPAEPEFDIDSLESLGGDTGGAAEAADLDSQFVGGEPAGGDAASEDTGAGADTSDGGSTEVSSDQEDLDTMLDLAKAYIDMGDADSASKALQEVIESGNATQRSEAEKLLETVQ